MKKLTAIIQPNQGHKSKSNDRYVKVFISWIENQRFEKNSINGEQQLKKEFKKDKDYFSKYSDEHYKEAIVDEKLGTKNC